MSEDIVYIPVYLSQVRLAVVTGIKGQTEGTWNVFQQKLNHTASDIEFDNEFGNPHIAEYDTSTVHTGNTYTYIEPTSYCKILSLVSKSPHKSFDTASSNQVHNHQDQGQGLNDYEEIDITARENQTTLEPYDKLMMSQSKTSQLTSKLHKHNRKYHVTPPALPERKPLPGLPALVSKDNSAESIYENGVPRTNLAPSTHTSPKLKPKPSPGAVSKFVREVKRHADVKKLSIDEVVEYLKKLNLGKYADTFKTEQIDGRLLIQLDKDMLKEDFDMKGVEALRLVTFAKKGHVPY
ncbi:uncharacterized protein LOC132717804 [Ruditapes philippinarum]|uniref:uncharacterized protein LOC132717804 n=1 Tax=Ruditapes philippinarum TaxID=129788 RepID=UPI00295BEB05|nr:uncharacterized protein LOC132717804 [Ruditapes philippinarum]